MRVEVKVIPGAKRRELKREGTRLKIKVVSPPDRGKANDELVEYLAGLFRIKKKDITILSGEKERRKVIDLPVDEGRFEAVVRDSEKAR